MSKFNTFNLQPRESVRGIGSTDARRIAAGEWPDLWDEKMGVVEPPNLTFAWKPRLGLLTEGLHAFWHSHFECSAKNQAAALIEPKLDTKGKSYVVVSRDTLHAEDKDARAFTSIDRWVVEDDCPLELKHTNERNSLSAAAAYYMAQLQWQLLVTGSDRLRFSIIRGNNEPEWGYVAEDLDYQIKLAKQVEAFWEHIISEDRPEVIDKEKGELAAMAKLAKQVPINGYRAYDLSTDNAWVAKAQDYIQQKRAADQFKVTNEELRKLIPLDASEVIGGGLSFKRDARGAYRVTILDEEEA